MPFSSCCSPPTLNTLSLAFVKDAPLFSSLFKCFEGAKPFDSNLIHGSVFFLGGLINTAETHHTPL
jgi:hypothetical protein